MLLFGLFFGCSRELDIVPVPTKGDLFLVQEGNSKKATPVIVAELNGQTLIATQSEPTLKQYFSYLTPEPIKTVSFEKVDGNYYLRGNDEISNFYYDLQLMSNKLYLLTSYSGCSGCGFCVMTSASSCSCNESSGSCSYNNGSVN